MQTPAEEYGLQEVCHILSPLGRTFNLLSRGTAPFQVAPLKDMHLPAFYSHSAPRFKRRESIWSKWHYTDCRCGISCTNSHTNWTSRPAKIRVGEFSVFNMKEMIIPFVSASIFTVGMRLFLGIKTRLMYGGIKLTMGPPWIEERRSKRFYF